VEAATIHLRTRTYLVLLLAAAALAVVLALATLGFLGAYGVVQDALWEDLPDALGVDPHPWYAMAVTTLGGLAVGLLLVVLPGHGGAGPAEGHGLEAEASPISHSAAIVLISFVSLVAGASLGPEAALIVVAVALGNVLASRSGRAELGRVFGMSGLGSVLSGLLGSPLAPAVMTLEVTHLTGRNLYVFLLPVLVASAVGLLTFDAILGGPLLAIDFPAYTDVDVSHLLEALAIGAAGAIVGLLTIAAFHVVRRAFAPVASPVVKATLGGLGIGLVALVAGEETLFSGEHELEVLLDDPEAYGFGALVLILGGKIVAFALSLECGFRGGRIFPVLFIGATVGFAATSVFDSIPLAVSAACGMTGAAVALIRLPVFVVLLVAFFASPSALPLIVLAAVVGYVLTFDRSGLGGAPEEDKKVATEEDLGQTGPASSPA
jgi:H+/Cl- antiporter ClcA